MSAFILSVARIDLTNLMVRRQAHLRNMLVFAGFALYPACGRL
jgi:hypothetical protein